MQMDNRFLDDLARVASGAFGALSGVRDEMQAQFRQQLERVLSQMDVVPREEHEAVREMAARAREEQEALADRVATLEATVATLVSEVALLREHAGPKRERTTTTRGKGGAESEPTPKPGGIG